eukprot:gene31705-38317_t
MNLDALEAKVLKVLGDDTEEIDPPTLICTLENFEYFVDSSANDNNVNVLLLLLNQIISRCLEQEGLEGILASAWNLYLPLLQTNASIVSPDVACLFVLPLSQVTVDGINVVLAAADGGSAEQMQQLESCIPLLWNFLERQSATYQCIPPSSSRTSCTLLSRDHMDSFMQLLVFYGVVCLHCLDLQSMYLARIGTVLTTAVGDVSPLDELRKLFHAASSNPHSEVVSPAYLNQYACVGLTELSLHILTNTTEPVACVCCAHLVLQSLHGLCTGLGGGVQVLDEQVEACLQRLVLALLHLRSRDEDAFRIVTDSLLPLLVDPVCASGVSLLGSALLSSLLSLLHPQDQRRALGRVLHALSSSPCVSPVYVRRAASALRMLMVACAEEAVRMCMHSLGCVVLGSGGGSLLTPQLREALIPLLPAQLLARHVDAPKMADLLSLLESPSLSLHMHTLRLVLDAGVAANLLSSDPTPTLQLLSRYSSNKKWGRQLFTCFYSLLLHAESAASGHDGVLGGMGYLVFLLSAHAWPPPVVAQVARSVHVVAGWKLETCAHQVIDYVVFVTSVVSKKESSKETSEMIRAALQRLVATITSSQQSASRNSSLRYLYVSLRLLPVPSGHWLGPLLREMEQIISSNIAGVEDGLGAGVDNDKTSVDYLPDLYCLAKIYRAIA